MTIMPIAELKLCGEKITDTVIANERSSFDWQNDECINKLYDEYVCPIGFCYTGSSGGGSNNLQYSKRIVSFITGRGEWRFALAKEICQIQPGSDDSCLELICYEDVFESHYGIENIQDIIPDKYEFILYSFI
jgi:hypothetical protein